MKSNYLISIIIPVYRTEKYIKACMESICHQNYKNFEVILVDNNSDDNSIEYAASVLENSKIKYKVIRETRQGQCYAKNKGIEEANGEWLCFIDSDDVINQDYLSCLTECAYETQSNVAFCNFTFDYNSVLNESSSGKKEYIRYSRNEISELFLQRKISLIIPGMLIKAELLQKNPDLQNNTKMKSGEDLQQIWMILANVESAGFCAIKLYGYRRRENSVTTGVEFDKVMSCHEGFVELCDRYLRYGYDDLAYFILYRQDFGLIRSTAQYADYKTFLKVRRSIFNKNMLKYLLKFADKRVPVLTIVLALFPLVFWQVNHYCYKV